MMLEQREIVLIPVPFTDLTSVKRRPVLILSSSTYNTANNDVVVAAITSNLEQGTYGCLIDAEDMERGQLPRRSKIRADKIYTLDKSIVVRRFGQIRSETFAQVIQEVTRVFES
jgi:mRNA interferase MazF